MGGAKEDLSLPAVSPGMTGGRMKSLSEAELNTIHAAVLQLLESTGLSLASEEMIQRITFAGGTLIGDRVCFPIKLVERALAEIPRGVVLASREDAPDLHLTGSRVYMGSGGAAPTIRDIQTGQYRDSTLNDLYDAARIVDKLEHVHFFSRSLVARDMPDTMSLDINTVYACLAGTNKHVCVSATDGAHAREIAEMCFMIAGSADAFRKKPFLSFMVNHVTPPMRFNTEACEVLEQGALLGVPIHCNIFGQVAASSPASLAGAIAQSAAEALAGMIYAWLVNPEVQAIFGPRPMVTDLRTGGFSGGGGEQALITAAMTQLAKYYGLSDSCIAGATDSKLADAQSGFEKSLTVNMAAQSGCNLITQACGMHAGLMGVSLESYLIDNDMLGGIASSLRPLDVTPDGLALDLIDSVVRGPGHFLGEQATMDRMKSDFLYPDISDRRTTKEWQDDGSLEVSQVAREKTLDLLATHRPHYIAAEIDSALRQRFQILL